MKNMRKSINQPFINTSAKIQNVNQTTPGYIAIGSWLAEQRDLLRCLSEDVAFSGVAAARSLKALDTKRIKKA